MSCFAKDWSELGLGWCPVRWWRGGEREDLPNMAVREPLALQTFLTTMEGNKAVLQVC